MDTSIYITSFAIFLICFILQLYFLIVRHSKLAAYQPPHQYPEQQVPVSVIISARTEVKNLALFLPSVLNQDYPDFEVVVINDCSFDDTEMLLEELQKEHKHLKVVTVTENVRHKTGKKFALTLGIKASKNEYLLFTDADCKPASNQWIALMARNFDDRTQIVLGYSPYSRGKGFINAFTRFETLRVGINYLSAALCGRAYMGVGRNLAYTKSLFFSSKGFAAHMHVLSGDDDLFVNQNATPDNVKIELDPDAFTYSPSKTSVSSWYKQKKRHMGVGSMYKSEHRRLLTIDALSGFCFYVLMIVALVFQRDPLLVLGLYLLRLIIQYAMYVRIYKKLKAKQFLYFLPFFDLVYYVYLNVFGLISMFVKTKQWK